VGRGAAGAWTFVALTFSHYEGAARRWATGVFIVGFAVSFLYILKDILKDILKRKRSQET